MSEVKTFKQLPTVFYHWTIVNNSLITCDSRGEIPLNSKVCAEFTDYPTAQSTKDLIEAAPDLRQAARVALGFLIASEHSTADGINFKDVIDLLRAALKKSDGDTP